MDEKPEIITCNVFFCMQDIVRVGSEHSRHAIDKFKKIVTSFRSGISNDCNILQKRFLLNEYFTAKQPVAWIKFRLLKSNANKSANSFSQDGFNFNGIDNIQLFRSHHEKQRK